MVRKLSPEKRAKLLNSALKLFVTNGIQHTSTAAIARDAGIAAGTLFLYFPTKQDLIDELALQIGRDQAEYMQSLLAPSLSARETFFKIWEGSIQWLMDNMDAYKYNQQVRNSKLISEAAVQESFKFFQYYFAAIQKGLAEGRIRPYPAEIIGGMLYQQIVAVMNLMDARPSSAKQAEYIKMGFEIFWNGIRTGEEPQPEKKREKRS